MTDAATGTWAVTGAFGYTGRYLAAQLLDRGAAVVNLTNHPHRPHPFGDRIRVAPMDFSDPAGLERSLAGVDVLYNSYYIRYPYRGVTFDDAVRNTRILLEAAAGAGVRRIVHASVVGVETHDHLPYYRGKREQEALVRAAGVPYAILRPTWIFGLGDVLTNNIAWMLRRFPVFVVPGDGRYRVQPVAAEDVARLAIEAAGAPENVVWDAAGPDVLTFEEMVRLLRDAVGSRARLVHLPPAITAAMARLMGLLLRDRVLTRQETEGLTSSVLVSDGPPRGHIGVRQWLEEAGGQLGRRYASEIGRRFRS